FDRKIQIVSEPGSLKTDELPLDSEELVPQFLGPDSGPKAGQELPVSEAEGDFKAVGKSVAFQLSRVLPGLESYLTEEAVRSLSQKQARYCLVQAQLFAPRGTGILSLERTKVLKALDDQQRPLSVYRGSRDGSVTTFSGGSENKKQESIGFSTSLEVPPDARSIELLKMELVVVTYNRWLEKTSTGLKEGLQMDLSSVMPGASLRVVKFKSNNADGSSNNLSGALSLELTGPETVSDIELEIKPTSTSGRFYNNGYTRSDRTRKKEDRSIRKVQMDYSIRSYDESGLEGAGLVLQARYPEGLKKQRVVVHLRGLDF
ncbi:MAG: hypothetical protein R3236_02545, partial [Phycisphaeraceae bacterium]|nr:hypothetical protein [Phycisphaeraceae bacterium]